MQTFEGWTTTQERGIRIKLDIYLSLEGARVKATLICVERIKGLGAVTLGNVLILTVIRSQITNSETKNNNNEMKTEMRITQFKSVWKKIG